VLSLSLFRGSQLEARGRARRPAKQRPLSGWSGAGVLSRRAVSLGFFFSVGALEPGRTRSPTEAAAARPPLTLIATGFGAFSSLAAGALDGTR